MRNRTNDKLERIPEIFYEALLEHQMINYNGIRLSLTKGVK